MLNFKSKNLFWTSIAGFFYLIKKNKKIVSVYYTLSLSCIKLDTRIEIIDMRKSTSFLNIQH